LPRTDKSKLNEETHDAADANAVVDYWINRLIQRPVADDKRQVLIDALGSTPQREESIRKMIQLIMSMPDYQLC
jgi:hypothetical protein